MNLTAFTDVDFKSEDDFREFLDMNALSHQTVHNALLEAGVVVEQYPLFTMAGIDEDWLEVHAREHQAWSSALSLPAPVDLDTVDFDDPEQKEAWLNNHALHHNLVAQSLGL